MANHGYLYSVSDRCLWVNNNRLTRDLEPRLRFIYAFLVLKLRKAFTEDIQLDIGKLPNFLATRSRLCGLSVFIT